MSFKLKEERCAFLEKALLQAIDAWGIGALINEKDEPELTQFLKEKGIDLTGT